MHKGGKEAAYRLANLVISVLCILFSLLIILAWVFTPFLIKVIAPGFALEGIKLAVLLTRILFPFIAFMGFATVIMGMLNSEEHFTVPALAPAIGNIVMILTGLFVCPLFSKAEESQVIVWSFGALFSGLVQVLIQLPIIYKKGFKLRYELDFKDPGIRQMGRVMAPAIFSNSIGQINVVFVNTFLASLLGSGAITYIYYGFRLMQLPIGLFGVAIATASFPMFSSFVAQGKKEEAKDTLSSSARLSLFVTVPATLGLIVLSHDITDLLFRHGKFTSEAAEATAIVTIYYALGLSLFSLNKILTPAFFALKKSTVPVVCGIVAILTNGLFSVILMEEMGYAALPLANTISTLLNFTMLYYFLRKEMGPLGGKSIIKTFWKVLLASCIMALAALFAAKAMHLNPGSGSPGLIQRIVIVLVPITLALPVYLGLARLLKIEEAKMLTEAVSRRIWKQKK
ncbi:MAG: murein biosynthesis integral membrane protein MurJ [Candidatus Firestonebacteria bacterium RIFOXYA2_FULL_40_8]|nr:MAG: murein biosynthesis integral membrane protein MurJ [Candidatus Firestonebacteria bacterium RIFOXYA2_FULL_40_8]